MQEQEQLAFERLEKCNPSLCFQLNLERLSDSRRLWSQSVGLTLSLSEESQTCVLFGIGCGEFDQQLSSWLDKDPKRKLFVLEPHLYHYLYYMRFAHPVILIDHPQVELLYLGDQDEATLLQLAWKSVYQGVQMICHPGYERAFENRARAVFERLDILQRSVKGVMNEYRYWGLDILQNILTNIASTPKFYHGKSLKDTMKGIPAIVVGGGPSLKAHYETLSQMAPLGLVIAGGSALNHFAKMQLSPDVITSVDPSPKKETEDLYAQFASDFAFQNRVAPSVLSKVEGRKIWMGHSGAYPLESEIYEELGVEDFAFDSGWNVSNFGIQLAKHLGCSPIILLGMDHAFDPNDLDSQSASLTLSKNGKEFHTKSDFYLASEWIAEHFCAEKTTRLINATDQGLPILGIESKTPHEALKFLESRSHVAQPKRCFEKTLCNLSCYHIHPEDLDEAIERVHQSVKRAEDVLHELDQDHLPEKRLAYYDVSLSKELFIEKHVLPLWEFWKQLLPTVEEGMNPTLRRLAFIKEVVDEANLYLVHNKRVINTYHLDGKVRSEKFTLDGLLTGPSRLFSDTGVLLSELQYEKGEKTGASMRYYVEGEVFSKLFYYRDQLHGKQYYYYKDGTPRSILQYLEGRMEGVQKLFWPNGQLKRKFNYLEGKKEGKEVYYYDNGQLKEEGVYSAGLPIKTHKSWHKNGRLSERREYLSPTRVNIHKWDLDQNPIYRAEFDADGHFTEWEVSQALCSV